MSKLQRWISLILCACLLAGVAALAETAPEAEVAEAVASTQPELADDTLVATVNGQPITWKDVKGQYESLVSNYGSYYDLTDSAVVNLFRSVALDNQISEALVLQQAAATGLDQFSEEEAAQIKAGAAEDWEAAIANFISQSFELTEESTEEEKAQARVAAEAYYLEQGYTLAILEDMYLRFESSSRVEAQATQDVVITDEEVDADYQALVEADKVLYENNIQGYLEYNNYVDQMAMYAAMYGMANDMEYAAYRPAGFRAVKHILLNVDETLMATYKDLQSRLEEQMSAETAEQEGEVVEATEAPAGEAEAAAAEPTPEPVTPADVDNAKADILASLSDVIGEINQKIAEGADFDELIAVYGVDADGNPTDPGMASEPYMTTGYDVARESTQVYVPEFVAAAFSMDNIGDVSAPYVSDYGVHIVKYIGDMEAGPIPMTAQQREARRASLLEDKKAELFTAKLDEWKAAAQITYTGVIPSIAELEAQEEEAEQEAAVSEEPVSEEWDAAEEAPAAGEEAAEPTAEPAS